MTELPSYLPQWISDHIKLYQEDPEKAHYWDATLGGGEGLLPTLLLTTVGRNSGQLRPIPLIYRQVGENYVIIASKGGAPAHPAWFLNLEARPECDVQVASRKMKATARVAEGEERVDLWAQLAQDYPPYDEYQQLAGDREIPVVVLEPR
ncbi:MAG: nitroreductase/quinone reductase family protein [Acidobacteriota bacterium]